jgi:hypothetical protein
MMARDVMSFPVIFLGRRCRPGRAAAPLVSRGCVTS